MYSIGVCVYPLSTSIKYISNLTSISREENSFRNLDSGMKVRRWIPE